MPKVTSRPEQDAEGNEIAQAHGKGASASVTRNIFNKPTQRGCYIELGKASIAFIFSLLLAFITYATVLKFNLANSYEATQTAIALLETSPTPTKLSSIQTPIFDSTHTPIPSNTPTLTPTSTPTPSPTPSPTSISTPTRMPPLMPVICTNKPQGEFADFWNVNVERLGCPIDKTPLYGSFTELPFERGHLFGIGNLDMYGEVNLIIATFGGQEEGDTGEWSTHSDNWNGEGLCTVSTPSSGLYLPDRSLGKIWCEIDGIDKLGYAIAPKEFVPDRGIDAIQNFDRAIVFRDSDGYSKKLVYVLLRDSGTYIRMGY